MICCYSILCYTIYCQAARDRAELNEASERNRDALFQKRSLVSQTARARQLDLLLRRSEIAQRYAEAKAARLEALFPPQFISRELRLFSWEAGLLKLVGRVSLATDGLREDLLSTGAGAGAGAGALKADYGAIELLGDKV